jgi:hypothetical protein
MGVGSQGDPRIGVTHERLHRWNGPTIDNEQATRRRVPHVVRCHRADVGNLDDLRPCPTTPVCVPNRSTSNPGEYETVKIRNRLVCKVSSQPVGKIGGHRYLSGTIGTLDPAHTFGLGH